MNDNWNSGTVIDWKGTITQQRHGKSGVHHTPSSEEGKWAFSNENDVSAKWGKGWPYGYQLCQECQVSQRGGWRWGTLRSILPCCLYLFLLGVGYGPPKIVRGSGGQQHLLSQHLSLVLFVLTLINLKWLHKRWRRKHLRFIVLLSCQTAS